MTSGNNRCYVRGWTLLGLLNTAIGCAFNRVIVVARDTETGKIVNVYIGVASLHTPAQDEE